MSGLVGSISHVYNDFNLTFKDILEIIDYASLNKLDNATEKIDGINLVFTCDENGVKIARSVNDVKSGGLTLQDLNERFENDNLVEVFKFAILTLENSLKILTPQELYKIFSGQKQKWFSIEVIHNTMKNIINYSENAVILHEYPVFIYGNNNLERFNNDLSTILLKKEMYKIKNCALKNGFKIFEAQNITICDLNKETVDNIKSQINSEMLNYNLNLDNTIHDYVYEKALINVKQFDLNKHTLTQIAKRIVKYEKYKTLTQLKKLVNIKDRHSIDKYVKSEKDLMKEFLSPIENILNEFSMELLTNQNSILMKNSQQEKLNIKEKVKNAIEIINKVNDKNSLKKLNDNLHKINFEKISAIEGIVFSYKDKLYKFTGCFAPINQILGMFKFGSMKEYKL